MSRRGNIEINISDAAKWTSSQNIFVGCTHSPRVVFGVIDQCLQRRVPCNSKPFRTFTGAIDPQYRSIKQENTFNHYSTMRHLEYIPSWSLPRQWLDLTTRVIRWAFDILISASTADHHFRFEVAGTCQRHQDAATCSGIRSVHAWEIW